MERDEVMRTAIRALGEDDYNEDGTPGVHALNDMLEDEGHEKTDAEERDRVWAKMNETQIENTEPVTVETTTIRLVEAMSDPAVVWVHGLGKTDIRVGETKTVPAEILPVLHESGAEYEEVSDG